MRFPIDVVYLDDSFTVLGKENIVPWRVGKHVKGAQMVLETAAGVTAPLDIGMRLTLGLVRLSA